MRQAFATDRTALERDMPIVASVSMPASWERTTTATRHRTWSVPSTWCAHGLAVEMGRSLGDVQDTRNHRLREFHLFTVLDDRERCCGD
jgi:hypothetical protein